MRVKKVKRGRGNFIAYLDVEFVRSEVNAGKGRRKRSKGEMEKEGEKGKGKGEMRER